MAGKTPWAQRRRTKYTRKRDIKPAKWYMIDLSDPLHPKVPSKFFEKRKDMLRVIEREFGLNCLVFPIQGAMVIANGHLLNCITTRTWGKVFRKYDYPKDLDLEGRRTHYRNLKRAERRKNKLGQ